MGIIKEKMKQDLEIRGLSKRTQESYLGCINPSTTFSYSNFLDIPVFSM